MIGRSYFRLWKGLRTFGGIRIALSFVVSIAFSLQCQATQTHIHGASSPMASFGSVDTAELPSGETESQKGDRFPDKHDPAHCPLCQVIASGASAIIPDATVRLLPVSTARSDLNQRSIHLHALMPRHGWLSRGPPARLPT